MEIDVYGAPSDGVVSQIKALTGHGVKVTLMPERIGGYLR
jgi:hypothetical protein